MRRANLLHGVTASKKRDRSKFVSKSSRNNRSRSVEPLESRQLLTGNVTISEIMYHPADGQVQNEWLEIHNTGDEAVDLTGFTITNGVDFEFPSTTLGASEFLVIAANVETFQLENPGVENVIGGWTGQLSNRSERITITDSFGFDVDTVRYADSGDWADRRPGELDIRSRGWTWVAAHDGGGKSLQLVNNQFDNAAADNWTASNQVGGTPGAPNDVVSTDIAPAIIEAAHSPIVPTSADEVTVTAEIQDENMAEVTASLFYRVSTDEPGEFIQTPMFDDGLHGDGAEGDGVFGAVLPSQADMTLVEFYVHASDSAGNIRTQPGPTSDDGAQEANMLYQVDDTEHPDDIPLYRWIMTEAERREFQTLNRNSDAQFNATFVATVGGETEVRYNAGVRYRGSGSRSNNPPNHRINLPNDRPWNGVSRFNLNTTAPHNQIAGSAIFAMAGLPAADSIPVRLLSNGENRARNGYYAHVEVLNGDWADRQFPDDGQGNSYKGRRANEGPAGGGGAGLQYLGTDPSRYVSYLKRTNASLGDYSDVMRLTEVLSNSPDETFLQDAAEVINIDQWLRMIAMTEVSGYSENGLITGDRAGDDYAMYRGIEDPRFQLVPYDLDGMFDGNNNFFRFENVPALRRLVTHPEVLPKYYGHLLDIADNVASPDRMEPIFRQMLGSVETGNRINRWLTFLGNRSAQVRNIVPLELTAESNMDTSNGLYRTGDETSGRLSGEANAVLTRSVTVNGEPATWDPRRGQWSITGITLAPGMNDLLVESRDEQGQVFESTSILVWRETSLETITGAISEDTTWTADSGPYRVDGNVTVARDATLTIEPGTNVYFSPGARLAVRGTLSAIGTEEARIWFTRLPTSGGAWNGIQFQNTMEDNRIEHAVIEYGVTGDGMVGVQRSNLTLNHVKLDHTDRRRIRSNDSSLVVTNSEFTAIFEPGVAPTTDNQSEHIWGGGIPDGGQFVVRNNTFGHITGHNDHIDFDAPRAPSPIPHIIGNKFAGGGDDALDLTGDAYIAGNEFSNFIKDRFNVDPGESNTISASGGTFTVIGNVFKNVQHASLVKESAFMNFVHNTVTGSEFAPLYFDLPGQTSGPGRGANVVGSIFDRSATTFDFVRNNTDLTVEYSWVTEDGLGYGDNNRTGNALVDPDTGQLLSGSPALGRGPGGTDIGIIGLSATITGEPAAITSANSATLRVNGADIVEYRYRLNDGDYSEARGIGVPIELTDLSDGPQTVQVIGRNSVGDWQSTEEPTVSLPWTVDSSLVQLQLHEILASSSIADETGSTADRIEIHNAGASAVNLAGMRLTDDLDDPDQFVFPFGTTIESGEYLVVYADDDEDGPGIYTGFNLNADGDSVYLFESAAQGGELLDSITFGKQVTDMSIARDRDGNWTAATPTLGAANSPLPLADTSHLRINEWLANAGMSSTNDFIELHNDSPAPIALAGLYLTDNLVGAPNQHQIAPLSFIGPNGFQAFIADGDPEDGADHLNFRLSSFVELVGLRTPDGDLIDSVRYINQFEDVSQGINPSDTTALTSFILPTPNSANFGAAVAESRELISYDSNWKFNDTGDDLGVAWRAVDFDDSEWEQGDGLLYVEGSALPGPKNTELNLGPRTFYFRKTIELPAEATTITDLELSTIIDDGAVVYVNGLEAFRIGMPNGPVDNSTRADRTVSNASIEGPFTIPSELLVAGENVIAVEVHQAGANSSDVVFGMELQGTVAVADPVQDRVISIVDSLRLTEIMYNPTGGSDFEFLEFQNVGEDPIELEGVRITRGVNFVFPAMTLEPGEFTVVVNATSNFQGRYGTTANVAGEFDGSLSNSNEQLRIQLPAPFEANVLRFEYRDSWDRRTDGSGFSLVVEDPTLARETWTEQDSWRASNFLGGSPGLADSGLDAGILVVNEIMVNTTDPVGQQIEIRNTTERAFDIGGWYLSDDTGQLDKFRIEQGISLAPGEFIVFNSTDHFGNTFTLSPEGGDVILSTPDAAGNLAGYQEVASYGPVLEGVSYGRHESSDGVAHFVVQEAATLGTSNSAPKIGPIVVTEIGMIESDAVGPFIELRNTSDTVVATSGWSLGGDLQFEFGDGVDLQPGNRLLITAIAPAEFRADYDVPPDTQVVGPYSGTLTIDAGDLSLFQPATIGNTAVSVLIDRVAYTDAAPWPTDVLPAATLNRVADAQFGNDPANWTTGIAFGTPGRDNVSADVSPASVPNNVTAVAETGPSIAIGWEASSDPETGIVGYRIYRDGEWIADTSTNRFVDANVTSQVEYEYSVSSINGQGLESDTSASVSIRMFDVVSVLSRLDTQVLIEFSEPVTQATAEDAANYSIEGVEVVSATLGATGQSVSLETSALSEGVEYNVVVGGLRASTGNPISPGTSLPFVYREGISGFTIRGVQTTRRSLRTVANADDVLARDITDSRITAEEVAIYPTINFSDDDGHETKGLFGDNSPFPTNTEGAEDNFAINATGLLTIPADRAGEWTFAATVESEPGGVIGFQIFPNGSTWKYSNQSQQDFAWRTRDFDDSNWDEGAGQFGYGDGDEQTVVDFGPDANNKPITTYFRREFNITNVDEVRTLNLGYLHDDGGAVYINGIEVHRNNLAPNAGATDPANSVWPNILENGPTSVLLDTDLPLVEGRNVIAVEVHQASAADDDLSFDMFLDATATDRLGQDGFRLRIDGEDVLLAEAPISARRMVGTVNLTAGAHPLDFTFFENNEGAEVELLAARGNFLSIGETDTWTLVGDLSAGGLRVISDPLPPTEIEWIRSEPAGISVFDYTAPVELTGQNVPVGFGTDLVAGEKISVGVSVENPVAAVTIEILDRIGRQLASKTIEPGADGVAIVDAVAESDGPVLIEVSTTVGSDGVLFAVLNSGIESELIGRQTSNDTAATAQVIDMIGNASADQLAIRGRTGGYVSTLSEANSLFAPNISTFVFDNIPERHGDATLTIEAVGDFIGEDKTLMVDIGGQLQEVLFAESYSGSVELEIPADLIAAAANGSLSVSVSTSENVIDTGNTNITLSLAVASDPDLYRIALTEGELISIATAADIQALQLRDSAGTLRASGVPTSGGRFSIREFTVPANGDYYLSVISGRDHAPNQDYSIVVTRGADIDVRPNDTIDKAVDISAYDTVRGFVGGALIAADDGTTGTATQPLLLVDGENFQWDVDFNGAIGDGTSDAYDTAFRLEGVFNSGTDATTEANGREFVMGPFLTFQQDGVEVTRKIYVSPDEGFARYLEVVTNTTNQPRQFQLRIASNFGSDDATNLIATSSGDTTFNQDDNWLVTDDASNGNDPALTHVFGGEGGMAAASATLDRDNYAFAYNLDLAANETQIVMHFAAQNTSRADAIAKAESLSQFDLGALNSVSTEELALIVNFLPVDVSDFYSMNLVADQQVRLVVTTSDGGTGVRQNTLVPSVAVYDPDGNEVTTNIDPEAESLTLSFDARVAGPHRIAVSDEGSGSGEYVLNIDSTPRVPTTVAVTETSPASGAILEDVPEVFTVTFSSDIDPTSLDSTDLTINGTPAVGYEMIDGATVAFRFSQTFSQDVVDYAVAVPSGAIRSLSGTELQAYEGSFQLDTIPPRISSIQWNDQDLPETSTLPAGNLSVTIGFDEAVNESLIDTQDIYLTERNLGTFRSPVIVDYDADAFTVNAIFSDMAEGDYTLWAISGSPAFEDVFGNDLDGESNPLSPDGSGTGDGVDGGNFTFDFRLDNPTIVSSDRLVPMGPNGSLARHINIEDRISFDGDVDSYQFELGTNETFDIELTSHDGDNLITVVVTDDSRNIVAESTAPNPGGPVRFESQRARLNGTYTVFISGTTIDAAYDLDFARNATTERSDSSATSPIAIDGSQTAFGVERIHAVGRFEPSATSSVVWGAQPASGRIVTINPDNGNIIDSFEAPDDLLPTHSRIGLSLAEGGRTLLYVNSDIDASVAYRLDPQTGAVKSTETIGNSVNSGLAANSGGVFIARDGASVQRQILGSPAIDNWVGDKTALSLGGDDSGRTFGLFSDGKLHEFDPITDADVFLSEFDAPAPDVEGLAFDGERLFASTASGQLMTLAPDTGAVENRVVVPGGPLFGLAGQTIRGAAGQITEIEPNNSRNQAQPIDDSFHLMFDDNIGQSDFTNTSTTIPHTTIVGSGNNSVDFFSFFAESGSVGIFDIDRTGGNMDAYLRLFDSQGNELAENDDFANDPGSDTSLDSFIEYTFTASGEYFIEVGTCCTAQPINNGNTYELHVSVEGHPTTVAQEFDLISERSIWKYWDQGTQPGLIWSAVEGVDDSLWAEGRGQLGYGDGDETTVVSYGPDASSKHTTTYFRHTFTVHDRSLITALRAELLRDDGAAVYLNGIEVIRDRLALGAGHDALATGTAVQGNAERTYHEFSVDPSLLVDGKNVIAVEVHQHSLDSDDLSFDMRLVAETRLTLESFAPTPDLDEYHLQLNAGDVIDVGLDGIGVEANSRLSIYDASGTVLLAESANADEAPAIRRFTAPDTGNYVVRASSAAATDYGLLVTKNAGFHSAGPMSLDGVNGFAGTIRSSGQSIAEDAEGDQVTSAAAIDADISTVSSVVEGDSLLITVEFYNDTIIGTEPDGSDGVFGLIEIDIDQNDTTGNPSLLAQIGEPGQSGGSVGVERLVNFGSFDSSFPVQNATTGEIAGQATVDVSEQAIVLTIPLDALDGEGTVNFNTLVGNEFVVSDVAPDADFVSSSSGSIVSDQYTVTVAEGQPIILATHTPLDQNEASTANMLDPNLIVRDADGNVVVQDDNSAADGRNAAVRIADAGTFTVEITGENGGDYSLTTQSAPNGMVLGRYLTYRESAHGAASFAYDKQPLSDGQTASAQNISSYDRGINGLVIDLLPAAGQESVSLDDFEFRVGNQGSAANWELAPAPANLIVAPNGGLAGSHRVTIIWDDGAIKNTWLQVTVKATAATGLGESDVFYFGNSVGETGNSTLDAAVNYLDALGAQDNASEDRPVPVFNRFDFNRDTLVNEQDAAIARSRFRDGMAPLRLLSLVNGQTEFVDQIPGDANGDGRFNSEDFVVVFQAGEYEDDVPGNSTFAEGDWNGDGDFTSRDFVAAFQYGAYDDGIVNVPLPVAARRSPMPNGVLDLLETRQDREHDTKQVATVDSVFDKFVQPHQPATRSVSETAPVNVSVSSRVPDVFRAMAEEDNWLEDDDDSSDTFIP